MSPAVSGSQYITNAGWDNAPHLSLDERKALEEITPPHLLPAVKYGIPVSSVGRIYQWDFSRITVDPFDMNPAWPRVFGFDPSPSRAAALWAAHDDFNDILYLYGEYHQTHHVPRLHAQSILLRGDWIPGVYDPSAEIKGQDGKKLIEVYRGVGMHNMYLADNAVVAGIQSVVDRVTTGRLKAFSTLGRMRFEWNNYRRDAKQKIVKENDDIVDCLRYICLNGIRRACVDPQYVGRRAGTFEETGIGDPIAGF